jgi:hypothetical protein
MKIEIDFSRPDELRKMKRELEMALSTIETALSAIGKNSIDPQQPTLPQIQKEAAPAPDPTPTETETAQNILESGYTIAHLVERMPTEFTSSDLFVAGEAESIPRSAVRREIAEMVDGNWLIMVEQGQGRRPSRFRKTP